jgi:DNA polymerase I
MTDIFLIDGNAIGFACHTGQKLVSGTQQTQAVYGIARTLRAMTIAYPKAKKVMLWDGRAQWRIDLYPDYKANREANKAMMDMREAYKSQRPYIERIVRALGVDQIRSPSCEADDLAAAFAQAFSQKKRNVRLISADRDWLQLVNEHVTWHDPIRDRLVTIENFEEQTGYRKPRQVLDVKCLMGDTSDNIKGVGGIGEVGAKKLVAAYGSVKNFLALADAGKLDNVPPAWQKLVDNEDGRRDRFLRNQTLMDLLGPAKPGVSERVLTEGQFSQDIVREVSEELAFHSILADLDNWLNPFKDKS